MTGFQDLEGQLLDAIERKRSRRAHRASAIIVVASSALVAALAVFAIVLLGPCTALCPLALRQSPSDGLRAGLLRPPT
jgi:hypothetical protein